jgi:hypothetical protein
MEHLQRERGKMRATNVAMAAMWLKGNPEAMLPALSNALAL